jgi:hypothetical protein
VSGRVIQVCNIFGVKFCKHLQLFAWALVLLFKKILVLKLMDHTVKEEQ